MSKHTPESTHDYATKRVNEAYREATGATDDIIKPSVKHTPSAGAMRAAEKIADCMIRGLTVKGGFKENEEIVKKESCESIALNFALIIDQEFAAIAKAEVGHE